MFPCNSVACFNNYQKCMTSHRVLIWAYALLSAAAVTLSPVNVLEIITADTVQRIFVNVSLGLNHHSTAMHACNSNGTYKKMSSADGLLSHTPNRRLQTSTIEDASKKLLQTAIVLPLGGRIKSGKSLSINGFLLVWDSWVNHFFSQNSDTTSLILLIDERDFFKQTSLKTPKEFIDNLLVSQMGAMPVQQIRIHSATSKKSIQLIPSLSNVIFPIKSSKFTYDKQGEGSYSYNMLQLDSNYYVYSVNPASATNTPLLIFVSIHKFPMPTWAKVKNLNEETLYTSFKSSLAKVYSSYAYIKFCNWFNYHMFKLKILDYFDYAGKIDYDILFHKAFPESNIPHHMAEKRLSVLTPHHTYYSDHLVAFDNAILNAMVSFVKQERKYCYDLSLSSQHPSATNHRQSVPFLKLAPGGHRDLTFWDQYNAKTWSSNIFFFWLGLYSAPEVLHFSHFWNEFTPGAWEYRWGDQQYWPRVLALFGEGNVKRELNFFSSQEGFSFCHRPFKIKFLSSNTVLKASAKLGIREERLKMVKTHVNANASRVDCIQIHQ